jgi:hypothetical protein
MTLGDELVQPPRRGRYRDGRGDADRVETLGAGVRCEPPLLLGRIGQKSRLA